MNFKFRRPAKFDDILRVETTLVKMPEVKIEFNYKIYNQHQELLSTAYTVLVFVDVNSRKPITCPNYILEKLKA